ncbi:uncharacterized protein RCO7_14496 [Rhynchosporium graminicola]|uniref:Uncharacterized protein n=1 Tax=Rhynchosporium graminicola TaxID=2792576 RepID=A0A1E1KKM1_9HELO|nr:uncharacterized protein RCO7_14496 [Rhynchosporium commune]
MSWLTNKTWFEALAIRGLGSLSGHFSAKPQDSRCLWLEHLPPGSTVADEAGYVNYGGRSVMTFVPDVIE